MKDHNQARWATGLVLGASLGGMLAAVRHGPSFLDSAFVSLRYARHLASGDGLVYNLGERVEGFGDPLWTVVVAAATAIGAPQMDAATALGVISLGAMVLLVGWIGIRHLGEGPGVLAAFLAAGWPATWVAARSGDDALFQAVLILWATGLICAEREDGVASRCTPLALSLLALTGLLGAVSALLLALVGVHRRRCGLGRLMVVLATLVALTIIRWSYFGDLIPNYIRAMPWGGVGRWTEGWNWLLQWVSEAPILAGLGLLGGMLSLVVRPTWRSTALIVALFVVLAVGAGPARVLLWHPVIPVVGLLALLGAGLLACMSRSPVALRVVLVVALAGFGLRDAQVAHDRASKVSKARRGRFVQARAMGRFLELRFPDDELVAMHKTGVVGHYTDNPILDLSGRSDRQIARVARRDLRATGKPSRSDIAGAIDRNPVVFLHPRSMTGARPGRIQVPPWYPKRFQSQYASVAITSRRHWELADMHPLWLFFFLKSGLEPAPEWLKQP